MTSLIISADIDEQYYEDAGMKEVNSVKLAEALFGHGHLCADCELRAL
jgi:hypothetical protein